jgi:sigma-E factor negative regulatory protein RseA
MSQDSLNQTLSSLLDEELSIEESSKLLDRIESDPSVREKWQRYCMMAEVMRSRTCLIPDRGFVDRVSTALADEPVILVPWFPRRGRREWAVSAALAASLAMVGILAGKSLSDYSPKRGPELFADTQAPLDPEFRDYLVTHYETAYLAGFHGMFSPVRLVSSAPGR